MSRKLLLLFCLLTAIFLAAMTPGCVKVTVTETKTQPTTGIQLTTSANTGGQTQTTSRTTATTLQSGATTSTKPVTTTSAKTTTSGQTGGLPVIADLKELTSYRYSVMTRIEEGTGAGMLDYMKYESVKAQKAEHAWREDADGKITEVYIIIGDKEWIYMSMFGWILQDARPATTTVASDELKKIFNDPNAYKARFTKIGSEEVNGIKCLHYEMEYTTKTEVPNIAGGGTRVIESHAVGEIWIADQTGMPKVLVLSKSTTDMVVGNEKTVMYMEQSVYDIGEPIIIEPPDEVFTPPTGPPARP